jgi:phospholipid/cholesterol/gamma-HCH transport system substrate-binding protein
LTDLSSSFKTVAGNLNTAIVELKPTLENFHALSDSLKTLELDATMKKVQTSLTKLNETLTKLNSGDNTASKLLTDDELYNNLNKLLLNLDTLANHFNSNPNHFLAPLGKSPKKIQRDLEKAKKNEQN